MDYAGQRRMRVKEDRLSELPDEIILKILSFVDLEDAIKTSVLSPRWRYLWTSIPHLTLASYNFSSMDKFTNFVTHVLSRHNNQAQLSYVKLVVFKTPSVVQTIMNHAFSLNVRQLEVVCMYWDDRNHPGASLSVSSAHTLKNFSLLTSSFNNERITLTSTRALSSLTTLSLDGITLHDDFISNCPNLENLTLTRCILLGSDIFTVSLPLLSNLTLEKPRPRPRPRPRPVIISLVTPQLKNLTLSSYSWLHYQVSAPRLESLLIEGDAPYIIPTNGFHSLEKAHLRVFFANSSYILSLLQILHNVKDLSLSIDTIQVLNVLLESNSRQPSPFANLKTLKVPRRKHDIMSTEVKNYLLGSSPKATLI